MKTAPPEAVPKIFFILYFFSIPRYLTGDVGLVFIIVFKFELPVMQQIYVNMLIITS